MNKMTATNPIPADFHKAVKMADEVSMKATVLHNTITDGEDITAQQVRTLAEEVGRFTRTPSKIKLDATTRVVLFRALDELFAAENAAAQGGYMQAAEALMAAGWHLEGVEAHVVDLFSPRRG